MQQQRNKYLYSLVGQQVQALVNLPGGGLAMLKGLLFTDGNDPPEYLVIENSRFSPEAIREIDLAEPPAEESAEESPASVRFKLGFLISKLRSLSANAEIYSDVEQYRKVTQVLEEMIVVTVRAAGYALALNKK